MRSLNRKLKDGTLHPSSSTETSHTRPHPKISEIHSQTHKRSSILFWSKLWADLFGHARIMQHLWLKRSSKAEPDEPGSAGTIIRRLKGNPSTIHQAVQPVPQQYSQQMGGWVESWNPGTQWMNLDDQWRDVLQFSPKIHKSQSQHPKLANPCSSSAIRTSCARISPLPLPPLPLPPGPACRVRRAALAKVCRSSCSIQLLHPVLEQIQGLRAEVQLLRAWDLL